MHSGPRVSPPSPARLRLALASCAREKAAVSQTYVPKILRVFVLHPIHPLGIVLKSSRHMSG